MRSLWTALFGVEEWGPSRDSQTQLLSFLCMYLCPSFLSFLPPQPPTSNSLKLSPLLSISPPHSLSLSLLFYLNWNNEAKLSNNSYCSVHLVHHFFLNNISQQAFTGQRRLTSSSQYLVLVSYTNEVMNQILSSFSGQEEAKLKKISDGDSLVELESSDLMNVCFSSKFLSWYDLFYLLELYILYFFLWDFIAANGTGSLCWWRWRMFKEKGYCRSSLGLHLHPAP